MSRSAQILLVLLAVEIILQEKCETAVVQNKGQVVENPIFIDNYIPASMQVIFHITDLMKYEITPTEGTGSNIGSSSSTTTTVRPTPAHKPGYYAPELPPSDVSRKGTRRVISNSNHYKTNEGSTHFVAISADEKLTTPLPQDLHLLGAMPSGLLHQINTLEDVDTIGDDDEQIAKFSLDYDDSGNVEFLRKKRVPPTRAYVTLLSLYDMLNKESKALGLNKFNGYTDKTLSELAETSSLTSEKQLNFVLSKVLQKKNTVTPQIVAKIKAVVADLDKPNGYIAEAIKYIPALQFTL